MYKKIINVSILLLLSLNVVYALSGVIHFPMQSMDTIGIWMFKAKAISLGTMGIFDMLFNPQFGYSHPQYPLLLPSLFSLLGSNGQRFSELPGLLLSPLIYVGILFFCYRTVREKMSRTGALLCTYMYSMFAPLLGEAGRGHSGNADIYIVMCVWVALYAFVRYKSASWMPFVVACSIAIASQIKLEGVFFISLLLFLPLSPRKKIFPLLLALFPALCWQIIIVLLHISSSPSLGVLPLMEMLPRMLVVFTDTGKELLKLNNWYVFWPLLGLLVLSTAHKPIKDRRFLLCAAAFVYTCYLLIYVFTKTDIHEYVVSSIDRLLLQISPILFFLFANCLQNVGNQIRELSPSSRAS